MHPVSYILKLLLQFWNYYEKVSAMIYKYISNCAKNTIKIAEKFGKMLKAGDVIAFKGDLGAGKTTFTRGIVIGMGMPDEVTSPTYSIVNEYKGIINVYHFDMYRIQTADELEAVGFFDYPKEKSVFIIEWAENIMDFLPDNVITVRLLSIDENCREIEIDGDERFADIGN